MLPVYVFSKSIGDIADNISHPTFGIYGDDAPINYNPTVPTVAINHYTTYTGEYAKLGIKNALNLVMPTSPTFSKTEKNIITSDEE